MESRGQARGQLSGKALYKHKSGPKFTTERYLRRFAHTILGV